MVDKQAFEDGRRLERLERRILTNLKSFRKSVENIDLPLFIGIEELFKNCENDYEEWRALSKKYSVPEQEVEKVKIAYHNTLRYLQSKKKQLI